MQFDRGYHLMPYARQRRFYSNAVLISGRPTGYRDCHDIGGFTEVAVKIYTRISYSYQYMFAVYHWIRSLLLAHYVIYPTLFPFAHTLLMPKLSFSKFPAHNRKAKIAEWTNDKNTLYRGYPADRALSAMRKNGG